MKRILIVDDKPENLYLLRTLLQGHHYEVDEARHGAEALVKARQSPPQLVISDLLMPVMDGFTLLCQWKADARLQPIPFVVYTATYTEPKDEQLALDLGADAFILKPTEPEPFMARIRAVLGAGQAGAFTPPKATEGDTKILLKNYSEVLVRKLETKTLQLEEKNQELEADIAKRKQTEDRLREREEQLRLYAQHSPAAIAMFDGDMKYLVASQRWMENNRFTDQSFLGRCHYEMVPDIPARWKEVHQRCLAGAIEKCDGEPFLRADHQTDWIRWEVRPWHRADGAIGGIIIFYEDITERKEAEQHIRQLNRVYTVLSAINQIIVRAKDPQALLAAACRIAVEKGEFRMAWIGLLDPATNQLNPVAAHGVVEGYTDCVKIDLGDQSLARGPAARCLFSGEHAVCNDIEHDPFYSPWRAEALQRGYQSSAGFPLKVDGEVVGVFNLYADQPDFFNPEELSLLDELALDISFALEVNRRESERRLAEAELRWRTAFFEAQAESALDGILAVDTKGKKILQNQRMADMWNIPPSVAGSDDDAAQVQFATNKVKNPAKFAAKVAYLYAHPDEASRDEIELVDGMVLDRTSFPVRDKAGKYYGRIWTFRDITEHKRVEESHARLAMAVEQSAETIVITDTNGSILYVNPAFEKTTGYTRVEALGQNPRILKSGKQDSEFYRQMWDALTRGEIWQGHFINRRKDGKHYEEDAIISPLRDATGKVINFVAVKRDVTHELQLESQFRQAQKMEAIGTLAGGIAHDFNNVLAAVFGYVYLLQQDTAENPAAQEDIGEILKAATRAKELVQQILTFSRQREQNRQIIRLDTIVKEATKFLRASLPAEIKFEIKLATDTPAVLANATQIYQVTVNLATNALHAMEGKAGQLSVRLESFFPDDNFLLANPQFKPIYYARLTVADTGHGMAASTLERIYEPFFTTKPIGKGTGLGLAVVHGIVKSHDALITVESEVGRGTTFDLYFPAQTDPATASDVAAGQLAAGHGQKILLLDDEPAVTAALQRLVARLNYQVTISNSAREAVALVCANPAQFDLVITDLTMPDFNGIEVARQMRAVRPDLPILLLSGYAPELHTENLRAAGIFKRLGKPVSLPDLAEAVHRALTKS